MSGKAVTYSRSGHVAVITLDRPGSGNVIDWEVAQDLQEACQQANQDAEVYAVVLTAAGDVFCRGSEMERLAASGMSLRDALAKGNGAARFEAAGVVAAIDRPVIAAVNGDALGQGLELALAADVRIASSTAHFGFPQVKAGLMPADGGTQRLPRIIGKGRALEFVLAAETIDAQQALGIGLVSQVVPAADVLKTALAFAQNAATKAPIALRYVKEAVNKGMDLTLEQGLRLEADLYFLIHTTADRTEGIRAFLEKRKADFKGK